MKTIMLSNGKGCMVDDDDYEYLNQFQWHEAKNRRKTTYARRRKYNQNNLLMHRVIMNPEKFQVDHIDGNGLNNQKSNLRICTPAQNSANQAKSINCLSKYKGVTVQAGHKKWVAKICKNYNKIYIGQFNTEEDAARAYNNAAIEMFGEFAKLNEIL